MSEFTHSASWEGSGFPIHEFPIAPGAVINAYKTFWKSANVSYEDRVAIAHSLRETNTYIADFCNNYLTSQTYDAATLAPLMPTTDTSETTVLRALQSYHEVSRDCYEDQLVVFGLLTDQPIIEGFWNEQVDALYLPDSEVHHALTTTEPTEITEDLWGQMPLGARAEDIMRLRTERGVNIESLLIKAAQTLEWLYSDDATNDSVTFQKVNQARSLYVPFCEIIGFDGLAMALNSRCLELQLLFTGRGHYVELAQSFIDNMGSPDAVAARTDRVLSAAFGISDHEEVLTHGATHGIVIGEGLCTDESLRVVWRRKSLGSLALKLAELDDTEIAEGNFPMDIMGATVIVPDTAKVGSTFREMLERLKHDPRVTLVPSPKREFAVHVRGAQYYLNTIRQQLGFESIEEMKQYVDVVESDPGGYQVTKLTFAYQEYGEPFPTLFEIQFNTESDRIQARVGTPSHALHKLSGGDTKHLIDTTALADLNAQKRHLGQNGLTSQSRDRALHLMAQVEALAA